MEKLKELYYDPKIGFLGFEKFYKKVKQSIPSISKSKVKEFYDEQEVNQRAKKPIVKRKEMLKINAPPLSFQIDVVLINKALKTQTSNDSYYFLLLVDIISRKAYIYPITDLTQESILDAYKLFLNDLQKDVDKLKNTPNEYPQDLPISIIGDQQFGAKAFTEYNDKLGVKLDTQTAKDDHISQGNRLGIIDRLVRTIKNILLKFVHSKSKLGSIKNIMETIIENYNDNAHAGLFDQTPNEVFDSKELRYEVWRSNNEHNIKILSKRIGLKVGDHVRVLVQKGTFDKEKLRFSKEIYTVVEIKGEKYKVNGFERLFKLHELQKVDKSKIQNAPEENVDVEIAQNKKQNKSKQILKQLEANAQNIQTNKRQSKLTNQVWEGLEQ